MANNQKATLHQMWLPEDLEHLMFSIKWHQFICNDKVRKQTGQPEFTAIVQPRRLTLFEHIWMITQMPRGSCQLSLQRTGGDHEDAPASHG